MYFLKTIKGKARLIEAIIVVFAIISVSVLSRTNTMLKPTVSLLPASSTSEKASDSSETNVAGQDITWSQQRINTDYMITGDRTSKSVTFASSRVLENITLEAVPEIARFVTIQPNRFVTLPVSQLQGVTLSFYIPTGTAFGTYEGALHVRSGKRTIPETLKVSVRVGPPPDPGEAGKSTLEGIDSDGDGVRDDIQRYITLAYPNSAKTRAALKQYAQTTQAFLLEANNKQASINHANEYHRAQDCLLYIRSSDASTIRKLLRAEILNTLLRSQAYIKADAQLSGEVFELTPINQQKSRCNFDPDTMEN